ncbi:keratin, type I cytoskeletal 9-like isoform X2 [Bacillus rossius redtenbacheri]|uniref:keratin, type I cytoskeletal 9-like isoform X2 n=1 Tax=Bacillus rossius redtenbacheri TaxID=93214 RepID=UPI002FDE5AAC
MVTSALLALLVAAASTIAFTPPVRDFMMDEEMAAELEYQERLRRGAPEVAQPAASGPQPQAASASFASSGSFSGAGAGAGSPGSQNGGGFGMSSDGGSGNVGSYPGYYGVPASYQFPSFNQQRPQYMPYDFYALFQQFFRQLQLMAQQQAYAANYYTPSIESNTVDFDAAHGSDVSGGGGYGQPAFFGFPYGGGAGSAPSRFGAGGGGSGYGGFSGGAGGVSSSASQPGSDVAGAAAVASLSPQGGYGYADVFPDLSSRFGAVGGEFPKPSGGSYGVFTSSSSGSSDIDGKKTNFKSATTGINDNGKVTVYTKHDP